MKEKRLRGIIEPNGQFALRPMDRVLGNEQLAGVLFDRLIRRVHILEINGESHHFKEGVRRMEKDSELKLIDSFRDEKSCERIVFMQVKLLNEKPKPNQ